MQLFTPIQLISFWFHEICMGNQQARGRELWFPGDVARYGGGIQIMYCSKLAPCVSSVLHCSKKTQSWHHSSEVSDCETPEIKNYTQPQTFLYPFNPCGSEAWLKQHWFNPCVDRKMHSCRELMNGPSSKANIHGLFCHLPLRWWKAALSQQTKAAFKTWKNEKQHLEQSQLFLLSSRLLAAEKQHRCNVEQFIMSQ